jgi:hypothetical protein
MTFSPEQNENEINLFKETNFISQGTLKATEKTKWLSDHLTIKQSALCSVYSVISI